MNRHRLSIFILSLASFIAGACSNYVSEPKSTLPYLNEILSDTSSEEYLRLASLTSAQAAGNIVISDNFERASSFQNYFLTCDLFDNITGAAAKDLLPDFAGEKILSIYDNGNAPYGLLLSEPYALREAAVKSVIATLDTASQAKISVLTSPFMAGYGMADVDTLIDATGSSLMVVSPLRLMAGQSAAYSRIGVFADSEAADSGIYESLFGKDRTFVYCDSVPSFEKFLAGYALAENPSALDFIIIDDVNVDAADVRKGIENIIEVDNYDNFAMRQLLGKNLKVQDSRETAAAEVYRLMRKNNIFTHKISYPEKQELRTDFRGDYSLYDVQDSHYTR